MVVHREGEVIGRKPVGLQQHVVVQCVVAKRHGSHHQVVKRRRAVDGDGLANDETFAARGASIGFRPGNRAAAAVIPLGLVTGALLGAHLLQALWSAEAAIGGAELEEHAGRLRVNLFTLGLDHRWLVPVHTEPVQALLDRGLAVGLETSTVRVLDAQEELAVFLAGEQVIEERGACAAEMQRPCWARRIANTDGFVDPGHLTIVLSGKCRPLRHINDGQICPRLH